MTGDQSLLKQINRMALVRAVRRESGLSRADLAKTTGLTKSTVSLLAQELLDEGWLDEQAVQVTGNLGRRPTPLSIDGGRLALVGLALDVDRIEVATLSLTGKVLTVQHEALLAGPPDAALDQMGALLAHALTQAGHSGRRVLGVGAGLPGAVDETRGVLRLAPNLGWRDVPVRHALEARLATAGHAGLSVHIQNEADVAAVGEFEFGPPEAPEPLVYLSLGVGVGAGVIVNGRLFLGVGGFAGEVGHQVLHPGGLRCSCGRSGCAEAYIGLRALAAAAGEPVDRLLGQVAAGHARARSAAMAGGEALGVLLQNLWTAFDPARFVLGGPSCELGAPFVDAALGALARYAADAGLQAPPVSVARFGRHAVAAGAAALVLHRAIRVL